MKLGIISHMSADWGGSEELWATAAESALASGVEVTACLLRPAFDHPRLRALKALGMAVMQEPARGSMAAGIVERTRRISWRLGETARARFSPLASLCRANPDVVLVNDGASIPTLEVMDAVERLAKPYVMLSQSNCGEILDVAFRAKAAAFYRRAHAALFVSQANLVATERQLMLTQPLTNARVVRNPVNLASLEPVAWPSEGRVSFACIGRLMVDDKGQDILFEALSSQEWQRRDWRLSIYGSGRHREYLIDLAHYFDLDDRIDFAGDTGDIRAVWRRHHALVLASRREGMPLVVVEAMICGRPIISTAIGGIPDWVEERVTGFIAEPTVDSFRSALERAWQRRVEWKVMGEKGRERAFAMHDRNPGQTVLSILMNHDADVNPRLDQPG